MFTLYCPRSIDQVPAVIRKLYWCQNKQSALGGDPIKCLFSQTRPCLSVLASFFSPKRVPLDLAPEFIYGLYGNCSLLTVHVTCSMTFTHQNIKNYSDSL